MLNTRVELKKQLPTFRNIKSEQAGHHKRETPVRVAHLAAVQTVPDLTVFQLYDGAKVIRIQ